MLLQPARLRVDFRRDRLLRPRPCKGRADGWGAGPRRV